MIHPSAIIEVGAQVAPDVEVGPYAVVESGAVIGAGCRMEAHSVVRRGAVLEEGVVVDCSAVVGGLPQDLHFDPATPSGVVVGRGTVIREHVTIHRATVPGTTTKVGAGCLLMATCHVAHDCQLGDGVILANAVLMGGHVSIGAGAFIGGTAAIHQHVRIGPRAMISGVSRITRDVPPFCMVAERDHLVGLNIVGLRRAGFTRNQIAQIKACYHAIFDEVGNARAKAAAFPTDMATEETTRLFLDFFCGGKRGFVQPGGSAIEE
jgi:UDP-N-acetylglucosamine acyltransferase